MKKILAVCGVVGMGAFSGLSVEAATQQAVLGESNDPVYSVRVQGTDNTIYKCKPDVSTRADGTRVRECIREDDDAGAAVFGSGTGIAGAGPAAAGLIVAVAVIGASGGSDGDSESATGSTASE